MKHILQTFKERGAAALSDKELLSLVLGDEQAAYNVMQKGGNSLLKIAGMYGHEFNDCMTLRKSATLQAVFELNRRKATEKVLNKKLEKSEDAAEFFKDMIGDAGHEIFMVLYLNRANKVLEASVLSSGGMVGTVCDPRIIIKHALDCKAVALILAHNHPSGNLRPSRQDEEITAKVKQAAMFFDIRVVDHLVVSREGFYSFADEGIL